jgi:hypothetical protein
MSTGVAFLDAWVAIGSQRAEDRPWPGAAAERKFRLRTVDTKFRIKKFGNGETFVPIGLGEEPPGSGWAIGPDGVYKDGVKVGERFKARSGSTNGVHGYSHIEYYALPEHDR